MVLSQFIEQFGFQNQRPGRFGVEREYFLVDWQGKIKPRAASFLFTANRSVLCADDEWGYELSACQVEHRTEPSDDLAVIRERLDKGQHIGREIAAVTASRLNAIEVAPADMPRDIYPFDDRYAQIAARLPSDILLAALRVTGVHIHYGVASIEEAIRVHNRFAEHLDEFIAAGDGSNGERLRLYKVVAPNCIPPRYESPEHFFRVAQQENFADNPRNCWHLVRITKHGTVELRAFGMTSNADKIISWIEMMKRVMQKG